MKWTAFLAAALTAAAAHAQITSQGTTAAGTNETPGSGGSAYTEPALDNQLGSSTFSTGNTLGSGDPGMNSGDAFNMNAGSGTRGSFGLSMPGQSSSHLYDTNNTTQTFGAGVLLPNTDSLNQSQPSDTFQGSSSATTQSGSDTFPMSQPTGSGTNNSGVNSQ